MNDAALKDPRKYYDEFSAWYENERHHGYHRFLDDMELRLIGPYVRGDVLEVGCGTGLILGRIAGPGVRAVGLDLSAGMLGRCLERGLSVVQATATHIPFADRTFDLVYSFKVLSHVPDIVAALREMARVTRPGGHLVLEFYNRHSLRYLIKRLKPAHKVAEATHDNEVFTRYDTLTEVRRWLPADTRCVAVHGIRVVTPAARVFSLPLLKTLAPRLEHGLTRSPVGRLGGFLVVVLQKQG